MPPINSRDFLKAAAQRFTAAEALQRLKMNLDSQYLAGYTIECALKALILHHTPLGDQQAMLDRITAGAQMHRPEVLFGILKDDCGIDKPLVIAERLRRRNRWTTDLRYEIGRGDTGETAGFLKTVQMIYHWVEKQLP